MTASRPSLLLEHHFAAHDRQQHLRVGDPIAFLRNIAKSLAPDGRLGIVDFKTDGAGGPGPPLDQRLGPDVVKRNAAQAGLSLVKEETFLRYQYFLIFGK